MWTSGALSVFNDNWADNFIEDPSSSDQLARAKSGQGTCKGQISPGGTEYLNLPGGDVITGKELHERKTQTSDADLRTTTCAPSAHSSSLVDSRASDNGDLFHSDTNLNLTNNDNPSFNFGQDFNMETAVDMPPFEWAFNPSPQPYVDPIQYSNQDSLVDFDIQQYISQNPNLYQQQLPGPFAPLSPALTPPPPSIIKSTENPTQSDTISSSRQQVENPAFDTDEQRWEATLARSHAAERSFLYGVNTTKIFCRPSCPSRRATRKNVEFFPFPGAIEAAIFADFRPCKRCKPDTIGTADAGILGVIKVLRLIVNDATSPFSPEETSTKLESLAEAGGLSAFHFHRLFKSTTKLTPGELIAACRSLALGDALGLENLDEKNQSESEHPQHQSINDAPPSASSLIANSTKWNPRTARKALGSVSPTDYAAGCRSLKVNRITTDTAQGPTCIAYSPHRGDVLAVLIGPDAEQRLRTRFPGIDPSDAHASKVEKCVKELQETGMDREGDIPEDLRGWLWRARMWVRVVRDNVLKDDMD